MPWASDPERSASSIAAAVTDASAAGSPQAQNASVMKDWMADAATRLVVSELTDMSVDQQLATAISSGNSSTHSGPLSVMMKVWPRKMPNRPSAVIGLGSAMITIPGLSTVSNASADTCSALICGLSVTRSMPWHCGARDCT